MAEIERGHISEITLHAQNANKGTARGRGVLEQSIRKHGAGRSLVLDKNKQAIAGNHAVEIMAEVGIENVVFVHTNGNEVVAVVRDDLDLDSEDGAARSMAVFDNRAGELGLSWSAENLLPVMAVSEDVNKLFTPGEAAKLAQQVDKVQYQVIPLLFAPDEVSELQQAWAEIELCLSGYAAQPEWWVARMADYDRVMGGLSDVMASKATQVSGQGKGKQIRYTHQAILYLLSFWKKHRGVGQANV